MRTTISARFSKFFCISHNNRSIVTNNVIPERCINNIDYITPDQIDLNGNRYATIEEIYGLIFEPYWREFQKKQMPCRRTDKSYYSYIQDKKYAKNFDPKKSPSPAIELIFQVSNIDQAAIGTENAEKCKVLLKNFFDDLSHRNYVCTITNKELNNPDWKPPFEYGFILVDAHIHADERGAASDTTASPSIGGCYHLHTVIIPYGHMNRGAEYQSLIGNCFTGLGYPTSFADITDSDGNKIPSRDKDNNIRYDKKHNIIYRQTPIRKGIIDWLEDNKQIIEKDMRERYGWERERQTDGRNTYLSCADYRVYKANQREKELNRKIDSLESDAFSVILSVLENKKSLTEKIATELSDGILSNLSSNETALVLNYLSNLSEPAREALINDIRFSKPTINIGETKETIEQRLRSAAVQDLKERMYDKDIKQLWNDYRQESKDFWDWYHEQEQLLQENKKRKSVELSDNNSHLMSTRLMLYYSHNLILNLLGLLLEYYLKHRQQALLEQIKQLTAARKELSAYSKEYSSAAYHEREAIKEITAQKKFLRSLKSSENTLERIKEKEPQISSLSI